MFLFWTEIEDISEYWNDFYKNKNLGIRFMEDFNFA